MDELTVLPDDPAYPLLREMRNSVADIRSLLAGIETRASAQVAHALVSALPKSLDRGIALTAALILVVTGTLSGVLGYWMHGDTRPVYGVVGGFEQCTDQPSGWRICLLPISIPPVAKAK